MSPVVTAGVIVGLGYYCLLILSLLRRYRIAVANVRSDDERYAARWLSRAAIAMLTLLGAWTAYDGYDIFVAPLDYFGAFGLYLIIAAVGCYLGIEGWRHADRRFPTIASASLLPSEVQATRDWPTVIAKWAEQVRLGAGMKILSCR